MSEFIAHHALSLGVIAVCIIAGLIFGAAMLISMRCPVCKCFTRKIEVETVMMGASSPTSARDFMVLETHSYVCTNPACSFVSEKPAAQFARYPTRADLAEASRVLRK